MPLERYQMPVIEKKTKRRPPGTSKTTQLPITSPNTKSELLTAVVKVIAIARFIGIVCTHRIW